MRTRSRALGGIAAQGSQALGSFGLQFLAARYLGLAGLGRFAVLFGLIILATSLSSGFVGDSLTVLDRTRHSIRAGLQWWLCLIAVGAGALAGVVAVLVGFLTITEAAAFALATITFVVEDAVRRLLMASMNFWRIVVIDLVAFVIGVAVVLSAGAAGEVTLTTVLFALAAGQVAAVIVGWQLVPSPERVWVSMGDPARRTVASYGTWRALQQGVRAGSLALVRIICLLVVTERAVGELAAARIYMAPAVLAVGGASSYLFASYARSTTVPLERLLPIADRAVVKLTVIVLAFGLVALAFMPVLGPVLTGDEYELSAFMVAGWAAYAASIAGVTPYGQLASVRGREAAVFGWRVFDSVGSLIATYVVVDRTGSVEWVPLILAAFPILSGIAIRQLVIKRDLAPPPRSSREVTAR